MYAFGISFDVVKGQLLFNLGFAYKSPIPEDVLASVARVAGNVASALRKIGMRIIGYIEAAVKKLIDVHTRVMSHITPWKNLAINATNFIDEWVLPAFDLSNTITKFVDAAVQAINKVVPIDQFIGVRGASGPVASCGVVWHRNSSPLPMPGWLRKSTKSWRLSRI